MNKKALIIIAHGSKLNSSNDEVRELSKIIEKQNQTTFDLVSCAFLEFAQPNIETGVHDAITRHQINEINFFPFFLNRGKHVNVDLPNVINHIGIQYPNIKTTLLPHFGSLPKISTLISEAVL